MKKLLLLSLLVLFGCSKEDNTALIESYTSQISSLNAQISQLNTQIAQSQSQITSLQSQVNSISGLEATIDNLNSQITDYQSQISSLQAEINSLNSQVANNSSLQATIDNLNTQIASNNEIISSLEAQIASLENNQTTTCTVVPPGEIPPAGTYTLNGQDSFGDGWNGAEVTYTINGIGTSFSVAGFSGSTSFTLYGSQRVTISFKGGEWDDEITYQIEYVDRYGNNAQTVLSDGPSPSETSKDLNICN